MHRIRSFMDFDKVNESLDPLENKLMLLEKSETYHTLLESKAMDIVKNTLSKFFLGSLSRIGMIDKARKILMDHEIAKIEKKYEIEDKIQDLMDKGYSSSSERESTGRKKDALLKEFDAFNKQQNLKIKQAMDYIRDVIDGNERRQDYFDIGRADDLIGLAELEYKLAKDRVDSSELKKFKIKIEKAREDAEDKFKVIKKAEEEAESSKKSGSTGSSAGAELEKEKVTVKTRKAKDIIERKKDLEKDIADIRAALERKLVALDKKIAKEKDSPISKKTLEKIEIELLELASQLDAKISLLMALRQLGSSESEIAKNIKSKAGFDRLVDQINKGISDSKNRKTGTKKYITEIFQDVVKGKKMDRSKIALTINKINK